MKKSKVHQNPFQFFIANQNWLCYQLIKFWREVCKIVLKILTATDVGVYYFKKCHWFIEWTLGTLRKRNCYSYVTLSFYSRVLWEYLRYSAYFKQKYVRYVCIFLHQRLLHTRNHIKIWWQSSSKQQNIECRLQPKARRNNGFDVKRKYFQTKLMHFGYNKTT